MNITACIGFSDEGSLLLDCVDHLLAIGVDNIVITEMSRTDSGATDLRDRLCSQRNISWIFMRQSKAEAFDFTQAMLDYATQNLSPDWLLFGDADEFWIPRGGNLRALLEAARYDVLQVPRFNLAVEMTARDPLPHDLRHPDGPLMFVGGPANSPGLLADSSGHRWISGGVAPKVLARTSVVSGLMLGMHDVIPSEGSTPRRARATDLVIAHLPFTTLERFRFKVQGIREVFVHHAHRFKGNEAWHWRRWIELEDAGRLDEEFQQQLLSSQTLKQWRADRLLLTPEEYFMTVGSDS